MTESNPEFKATPSLVFDGGSTVSEGTFRGLMKGEEGGDCDTLGIASYVPTPEELRDWNALPKATPKQLAAIEEQTPEEQRRAVGILAQKAVDKNRRLRQRVNNVEQLN